MAEDIGAVNVIVGERLFGLVRLFLWFGEVFIEKLEILLELWAVEEVFIEFGGGFGGFIETCLGWSQIDMEDVLGRILIILIVQGLHRGSFVSCSL